MALFARHASDLCRCQHARDAHTHYRRGTDCALCAPGACARFRKAWRSTPEIVVTDSIPDAPDSESRVAS